MAFFVNRCDFPAKRAHRQPHYESMWSCWQDDGFGNCLSLLEDNFTIGILIWSGYLIGCDEHDRSDLFNYMCQEEQ